MKISCFLFRGLFVVIIILTLLGSSPVEPPFVLMRQLATGGYFIFLLCFALL